MGPEFFQTRMGQTFFEGTMPRIAANLERVATALERIAAALEAKPPKAVMPSTEICDPGEGRR